MLLFKLKYLLFFLIPLPHDTKSNVTCGIENTNRSLRKNGNTSGMERFPWMGILYYPMRNKRYTTSVILVTQQMVIASAIEIDKFPKVDFRKKTKVVFGHNCGQKGEIGVQEYTYHPDFSKNTYSALAIVQLEVDHVREELRPICPPPEYFVEPRFYAMTVTDDCLTAEVNMYEMKPVDMQECQQFYRRSGLDLDSFWPSHTTCAKAVSGGKCLWRSGTALVVQLSGRWRLLGFGVYGPGCEDPARFLDYGMYHQWMLNSVRRVGLATISLIAPNYVVLRKKRAGIQRYGDCDDEEKMVELYSDTVRLDTNTRYHKSHSRKRVLYNFSLYDQYDYHCIVFKATYNFYDVKAKLITEELAKKKEAFPTIHVRRWCSASPRLCHDPQYLEVNFGVEILFQHKTTFTVHIYGTVPQMIDPKAVVKYVNIMYNMTPPRLLLYIGEIVPRLKLLKIPYRTLNRWFYLNDFMG